MKRLVVDSGINPTARRWRAWLWLLGWTVAAVAAGWFARELWLDKADPLRRFPVVSQFDLTSAVPEEHWKVESSYGRFIRTEESSGKVEMWDPNIAKWYGLGHVSNDGYTAATPPPITPRSSPQPNLEESSARLLTQSPWQDSEGEAYTYKFGPLNSLASWSIGVPNRFNLVNQLAVNGLYQDSNGVKWRYLGGKATNTESWAAMARRPTADEFLDMP